MSKAWTFIGGILTGVAGVFTGGAGKRLQSNCRAEIGVISLSCPADAFIFSIDVWARC